MNDNPLIGKRIVNTRSIDQAAPLDALLRREGAIPVAYPCIRIEPLADPGELDATLDGAMSGAYDWVLFTSVNTVRAVAERLSAREATAWPAAPCRMAAVGRATAAAVERELGRAVDLVPTQQHAAALAAALPLRVGERVLLPASMKAGPELADALRARGAIVTAIAAYDTVAVTQETDIRSLIGAVDAVTFASPSAVTSFADQLRAAGLEPASLGGLVVACIGPTTLAAAGARRFPAPTMAREQSLAGLIQILQAAFANSHEQEATQAR